MTTTNTESCSTSGGNKFTTVKTVYARAAIVLLALNFCLTGYVVLNMTQATQAQIDSLTESSASTTPLSLKATPQTPAATESQGEQPALPTREKE
jgi:hypothetical protein